LVTGGVWLVVVVQFYNSAGDDVTPRPLLANDHKSQLAAAFFSADSASDTVTSRHSLHMADQMVNCTVSCLDSRHSTAPLTIWSPVFIALTFTWCEIPFPFLPVPFLPHSVSLRSTHPSPSLPFLFRRQRH